MDRLNKIFRLVINPASSDGEKISGIKRIQEYIESNNTDIFLSKENNNHTDKIATDAMFLYEIRYLKSVIASLEYKLSSNKEKYDDLLILFASSEQLSKSQKIQIEMLENRVKILNNKNKSAYRICAFISFIVFLICVLVATVFKGISVNLNGTDWVMISSFCILLIMLFLDEIKI